MRVITLREVRPRMWQIFNDYGDALGEEHHFDDFAEAYEFGRAWCSSWTDLILEMEPLEGGC